MTVEDIHAKIKAEQYEREKTLKGLRADVLMTFSTESGKNVLNQLMKQYNVLHSTHVTDNSHETAFLEGQRKVVLDILDIMGREITPADFAREY